MCALCAQRSSRLGELSLRHNKLEQLPAELLLSQPVERLRLHLEGNSARLVEMVTPALLLEYVKRLRAEPEHTHHTAVSLWGDGANGKSTVADILAAPKRKPFPAGECERWRGHRSSVAHDRVLLIYFCSDETKWSLADVLEWMEHRSGVDELASFLRNSKVVSAVQDCFVRSHANLLGQPFDSLFRSADRALRLTNRVQEAVAGVLEACKRAQHGTSLRTPLFAVTTIALFDADPFLAVRAPFVYLTTHGLRTRSLELDIADHRKSCKLKCPVQDKVDVSVADMGGQVSVSARVADTRPLSNRTAPRARRMSTRTCARPWPASAPLTWWWAPSACTRRWWAHWWRRASSP